MAAFLARAYHFADGPDPDFDDIAAGAWYAADVARLAASGITQGCGDGAGFCPDRSTTRAQMAAFLARAETRRYDREERTAFSIEERPGNGPLISASRGSTCAVRLDGGVTCWGSGRLRDRYALAGLQNVVAVSTGNPDQGAHTCALHSDGTISCWGDASNGELGQGDTDTHYLPVRVPGITDAAAVSAGPNHTCAAHRDGGVSCWGANTVGRADDGPRMAGHSPRRVPGLSEVVALASGTDNTCAVHRDGSVSCWGSPYTHADPAPKRISTRSMISVGAGWGRVCAATVAGSVYCWRPSSGNPRLNHITELTEVVEVSVGNETLCALHRDGGISCLGVNDVGQVGDGTTTRRSKPVRLDGVSDAVAVSVGVGRLLDSDPVGPHACLLHADGSASCWGANEVGQLGDGTTAKSLVPTRVRQPLPIPADQTPATATDLLRAWIEALVQEREAEYPWMRVAWDHIRDSTEAGRLGGGNVLTSCHTTAGEFGCRAEDMLITRMSEGIAVHELLHVYDLHTGLAPRAAWGAVQLYFATTYPDCFADNGYHGAEILADTVTRIMVPSEFLAYYNLPGCPTLPGGGEPTAEAERVASQGLAGKVPDWYRENITNGAELWEAWRRGPSLPALANLSDEFGGLCSTDWITPLLDSDRFHEAGSNPFRDGGC
ncbi:MAG: hypothetical protein F4017_11655 [Acidimicrobiaceae bacterium]|nr:hypothetical protein [Acidimicrobiaceae bacterium]MYE75155.1 hypothetical protein [Acidimicrobiaceae bacterium]MYH44577.1 hypothetical protein [Acidimicrobiaceae bacterium]MYK75221.1 hypothetical protein [Acidimicrobiaceae bacterium]